ncbi:hypothetical protein BJY01DRAFT_258511 [Aspergillus pseudoustus]|uniref:Lactonase, 7-bladed beta-propeller-domain-containing protein n=1 Tax=Aspergillus pseudoustus TaxID=1810923 RepID=A0ABR4JA49_9EURO
MHFSSTTALLLAASAVNARPPHGANKAIYVLTNTADNAIIGLPIDHRGYLANGQVTLTGGRGSNALDSDGEPSGPDALYSQAPLTVAGEYVFAINPGSNTLSMLAAHPHTPSLLSLIGEPASIPGEFPVSVAASPKNNLVCVATTGAKAGISCASYSDHGVSPLDNIRPYALNQTTPPTGPPNTVTHTFFSDDETHLLTTVKGVPNTSNKGFLSVFPVERSSSSSPCRPRDPSTSATLGKQDIRSSFNGTSLLFGAAPIPSTSNILITDPSFGAALVNVNQETSYATLLSRTEIPNQGATCWASYSATRASVFVTDGTLNRLVELDASDARIVSIANLPNQDPGYTDLYVDGDIVYALSPGNGTTDAAVAVYDARIEKQVQHVSLREYGADKNAAGVAFLQV